MIFLVSDRKYLANEGGEYDKKPKIVSNLKDRNDICIIHSDLASVEILQEHLKHVLFSIPESLVFLSPQRLPDKLEFLLILFSSHWPRSSYCKYESSQEDAHHHHHLHPPAHQHDLEDIRACTEYQPMGWQLLLTNH